jgi:hypothetical protein
VAALLTIIILFAFLVLFPLKYISNDAPQYSRILIRDVSVVDVVNDTILVHQNILIRGNLIERIFSTDTVTILKESAVKQTGRKVIEGRGWYVIPALWDMHAHLIRSSPYLAYPAFITHGVTHVRDMRGAYNDRDPFAAVQRRVKQWNQEVLSGKLLGPQVLGYTSFAVEGPHPMFKKSPRFSTVQPHNRQSNW